MKRLVITTLALSLLTGCGGDDTDARKQKTDAMAAEFRKQFTEGKVSATEPAAPEKRKANKKPKPVASSGGAKLDLTPEQRDLYIEARTMCGLVPPSQVAGDFGMSPDSNPAAIARRYARAYPDPGLNGAAELGCYAGLVARD